jgi:hypothetical protein
MKFQQPDITKIFTLVQHTPMIHFQSQQDGATLRASEVKPKLDKFIYTIFKEKFGENYPAADYPATFWEQFNPESKAMSKYKIHIEGIGALTKYLVANLLNKEKKDALNSKGIEFKAGTAHFAQESEYKDIFIESGRRRERDREIIEFKVEDKFEEKISKWGILHRSGLNLTVSSVNTEVFKVVCDAIPVLFLYENFGTRQSKGFGSFSVKNVTNEENIIQHLYSSCYYKDSGEPLTSIQENYKLLKSGRGSREPKGYEKSILFEYAVQDKINIRWEKRKIKQEIHSDPDRHRLTYSSAPIHSANPDGQGWQDSPNSNFNYKYLRALLGLAEQFEFAHRGGAKYQVAVKCTDGKIKRFRSPILFKVIGKRIYLLANDLDKNIFDKEFVFSLDRKPLTTLKTPVKFDIHVFLEFATTKIGFTKL